MNELKELKGTERQVKFATDIRRYVLFQLEHAEEQGLNQENADKVASVIKRTSKAKFIIDTFADSFYQHYVLVNTDILFDHAENLQAAKRLKQTDLAGFSSNPYQIDNHNNHLKHRIEDAPFEDKTSQKNQKLGHNTKIIEKYLRYLASDIESGYYSKQCENKIIDAMVELKKLNYDTKNYKAQLTKLLPHFDIFEIETRFDWLKYYQHTDDKIKSIADEICKYIADLETYNSDIAKEDSDKIDTERYNHRLADAIKNAKKYDHKKKKQEKFVPSFISEYAYEIGDKLIRHNSAIEIIKVKKQYLSNNAIEDMQEVGSLPEWEDYRSGNYFFIYYKNINDTDEGKELLKQYQDEKKKEKERRKFRRKTEKAFSNFIQEYKKSDNFLSEQNFKDNYQDTLKKAHKIYKENDYMGMHDYLAVYDNLLFIADYNGLDGDNWSLNNFGSYRVWVAKLSKEKLDKLNQIIEDLNKVKD